MSLLQRYWTYFIQPRSFQNFSFFKSGANLALGPKISWTSYAILISFSSSQNLGYWLTGRAKMSSIRPLVKSEPPGSIWSVNEVKDFWNHIIISKHSFNINIGTHFYSIFEKIGLYKNGLYFIYGSSDVEFCWLTKSNQVV